MTVEQRITGPTAGFEVRVEPAREVVRVKAIGELDLATGPELHGKVVELVAVGFEHVIIDLRGLSFIDASSVGLLLRLADQARASGWRLSLIPGDDRVQRVLALTGAGERLPFCGPAHRSLMSRHEREPAVDPGDGIASRLGLQHAADTA